MKSTNIVIIIPAYNEEKTIGKIVEKSRKYGSVIVIDDASHDNTGKIASMHGAYVIRHEKNSGLGSSLRTGFKKALSMNCNIIITLDGDDQHNPDDIPQFLEKINKGYDFILGKRIFIRYPFFKRFGNFFLNNATNFISGTKLKDTECGFRAFRKNALSKFYLKADRYAIAVEIVFEVGRNKLKACNVPISLPIYVKGVGFMDGIKNFIFLLHRRKRRWRDYIEDLKYILKQWL
ncbi:MAG: glycosyltransferase family 2 protein [Candidatus Aenigmatarchaeota archaeon]